MVASATTQTRAVIGQVQRLCCAGGGLAGVPLLMSYVQKLVPAASLQVNWTSPALQIAQSYWEGPIVEMLPAYAAVYHNKREREVRYTFEQMMRARYDQPAGEGFARMLSVSHRDYARSTFANELALPIRHTRLAHLKPVEAGRPLGQMFLWRTEQDPAFAPREFRLLNLIAPFLAHGIGGGDADADVHDSTEETAMLIADHDGRLLHRSSEAARLLLLALAPRWAPNSVVPRELEQPPEIARLCRSLVASCTGRLPAAPPVLHRRTVWGEFVLRAHWLQPVAAEAPRYIGITIERREPRSLGLLRNIEALPLTAREKQLCLLLARGYDTRGIAAVMGISAHTVISHRRNLYAKLGVENRHALIERLRPITS